MQDDEIIERVVRRVLDMLETRGHPGLEEESTHLGRPATVRRIVSAGACRVSQRFPTGPVDDDLAICIDHTLLRPEATYQQVEVLCGEAAEHHFASVVVHPVHVALAVQRLRGTGVPVCTVVGFPLGTTTTEVKVFETRQAVQEGAGEIDMVLHVGALKSGDLVGVERDIRLVGEACGGRALLKVILEAALLTDEEKVQACCLAQMAGADFVKTSTGFGPGGATLHDVELMRRTVGEHLGVKAAGGIRDRDTVERMIAAGADRIGASASVAILREGASGSA